MIRRLLLSFTAPPSHRTGANPWPRSLKTRRRTRPYHRCCHRKTAFCSSTKLSLPPLTRLTWTQKKTRSGPTPKCHGVSRVSAAQLANRRGEPSLAGTWSLPRTRGSHRTPSVQWPNGRAPRWLRPRAATPSTSRNPRLSRLSLNRPPVKTRGLLSLSKPQALTTRAQMSAARRCLSHQRSTTRTFFPRTGLRAYAAVAFYHRYVVPPRTPR